MSRLRSGAGGNPAGLTVGGKDVINNLGYFMGDGVDVKSVQTNHQTRIDQTGMVNCDSLQVRGTQRIDTNGVYRGSLQWNDHVYAGDFGIMAGGAAGPVGAVGVSGSFTTANGKTVTVWGGIITAISP
jgi:subtilisin family serine protease